MGPGWEDGHTPGARGAPEVQCEFLLSNTPKGHPASHSGSQAIRTDNVRLADTDPSANFVPVARIPEQRARCPAEAGGPRRAAGGGCRPRRLCGRNAVRQRVPPRLQDKLQSDNRHGPGCGATTAHPAGRHAAARTQGSPQRATATSLPHRALRSTRDTQHTQRTVSRVRGSEGHARKSPGRRHGAARERGTAGGAGGLPGGEGGGHRGFRRTADAHTPLQTRVAWVSGKDFAEATECWDWANRDTATVGVGLLPRAVGTRVSPGRLYFFTCDLQRRFCMYPIPFL